MSDAKILYCHCAFAKVIPAEVKQAVLAGLVESGVEFDSVADLCEMSARRDPKMKSLAERTGSRIAACHPRAVKGLFAAAGHPLADETTHIVNMRVLSAQDACAQLTVSQS